MRSFTRPACCRCASERHSNRTTSASSMRSEEHTSELQSRLHLVCRLLLEKKKKHDNTISRAAKRGDNVHRAKEPRSRIVARTTRSVNKRAHERNCFPIIMTYRAIRWRVYH